MGKYVFTTVMLPYCSSIYSRIPEHEKLTNGSNITVNENTVIMQYLLIQ